MYFLPTIPVFLVNSLQGEPLAHVANAMETDGGRSPAHVSGGVASSSKPPIASSATRARDYAISDTQDPEQRSASEISTRKVQKMNKDLMKQNTQLAKDVDSLKKEREALLSDKQKLKSDNKTLERELRRVSSKGEVQRLLKNGPAEIDQEFVAEQRLLEKDRKIEALMKRIETTLKALKQDEVVDNKEFDKNSPQSERHSMKQTNGGIWDSGVPLEHHVDVQNIISALKKENLELRSRIASLEGELEQTAKGSSPKNSRIKPGNFFRRSKRQTGEIQKEKLVQASSDGPRARSPDIALRERPTFDTPSSSVEGTPVHKSIPIHISPNQSPKFDARDMRSGEIQVLQSKLKSAIDERKSFEDQNKALDEELHKARSQLEQLEAKANEERKVRDEVEKVKKSLKMANSEKASLSGQVEHLRKEMDEVKAGRRSAERSMAESLKRKDNKIEDLEMECSKTKREAEKLQKELYSVNSSNAEAKMKETKVEELHLECSKMKDECEKLRKELNSANISLKESRKKDGRISELEKECSRAKKECEKLQKELESMKVSMSEVRAAKAAETKESTKLTSPTTNIPSHTAAKPPSGARITSPSHSAGSKSVQGAVKATTTSTVKTTPPTAVNVTTTDDVFETGAESSCKSPSESTLTKLTRKSSGDVVEKRASSQSRTRDPANPPVLRKRRSSTELIELFEHPQEIQKPVEVTVKRNASFAVLATSVSHRAKVAATRAMFEGKNGEETTSSSSMTAAATNLRSKTSSASNRSAYRRSWTGGLDQHHRSSDNAAIPESKKGDVFHAKSQSLDVTQQLKSEAPAQQVNTPPSPTTAGVKKTNISSTVGSGSPKHSASASVAPSKPTSLNLGSNVSVKVSSSSSTSQHSMSSTPSSSSSKGTPNSTPNSLTVTPTSAGGTKVSKITIKSSSASCSSPKVNGHREVNEVVVGSSMRAEKVVIPNSPTGTTTTTSTRSRVLSSTSSLNSATASAPLRSPTTPSRSPTTPFKSPSTGCSGGVPKSPSYVPSYVRSNTVPTPNPTANRVGSRSANEAKPQVARSQTAVTFTVTPAGSKPQPLKTNVGSPIHPAQQREQGVLKNSLSMSNACSDVKNTSSLLDIPESVDENESNTTSNNSGSTTVGNSNPPSSTSNSLTTPAVKVMHRSPVQSRVQRRKREDRPKTMYVGARSETVSLVRLISKYQEQERREKGEANTNATELTKPAAISAPASTQVPAVNGNASPIPAAATMYSSSAANSAGCSKSSGSTPTVARSRSPLRRPQSYYGGSADL